MKRIFAGVLFALVGCSVPALGVAGEAGVVQVTVGAAVARDWDVAKAANYAYGPKQEVDAESGETHVYLPYGNNPELYAEVKGVLVDPQGCALFRSVDGNTSARLTYKLTFDKPISSFRFSTGWVEFGLADNTVGGVEYSTDGTTWKPVVEVKAEAKTVEPLADKVAISGFNTQILLLRYFSREAGNADSGFGAGRWIQVRMSGDPQWGDAATSFFVAQPQIWVK